MSVLIPGFLKAIKHPMVSVHISMHTSIEVKMYEELDCFERALQHFGTRVEIITAMEMQTKLKQRMLINKSKRNLKNSKR